MLTLAKYIDLVIKLIKQVYHPRSPFIPTYLLERGFLKGLASVRQLKRCKNDAHPMSVVNSSISHRNSPDMVHQISVLGTILKFNYVIVKDSVCLSPLGWLSATPHVVPPEGYSYSGSIYKCLPVYEGPLVEERTDVSV